MERIRTIDALKGYAILLVILGHLIVLTDTENFSKNNLFVFIYSFHMPLLFFLSGYLAYGKLINLRQFFMHRAIVLIYPYILWNFVGNATVALFSTPVDIVAAMRKIVYDYENLWFLPTLFLSLVILAIFIYIERKIGKFAIALFGFVYIAVMWLLINPPFQGFLVVRWFAPFVIVGYSAHEYQDYLSRYKTYIYIIILCIFPLLLPQWNMQIIQFSIYDPLILINAFILALSGIVLSYMLIASIENMKLDLIYNFFIICGAYSLEMYIISNYLALLHSIFNITLWFGNGLISLYSGLLIIGLFSCFISIVLSHKRYISLVIFGRWFLEKFNIKSHLKI